MLDQIREEAFRDELEKIAESALDPDVRNERLSTARVGHFLPGLGLLSGSIGGMIAGGKLGKAKFGLRGDLLGSIAGGFAGLTAGTGAGAVLQKYLRDRHVDKMPEGNKFKRIYNKNRVGGGDKEMKDFSRRYNKAVGSLPKKDAIKSLSKKDREIANTLGIG